MFIFSSLKAYKTFIVVGVFLVIVGGLTIKLKLAQHQRDVAQAQLAVLSLQVEQQNEAVQRWKQQAEKQAQRLTVATRQAQQVRNQYQQEAQGILNQTVATDCTAAVSWAASIAKNLASHH